MRIKYGPLTDGKPATDITNHDPAIPKLSWPWLWWTSVREWIYTHTYIAHTHTSHIHIYYTCINTYTTHIHTLHLHIHIYYTYAYTHITHTHIDTYTRSQVFQAALELTMKARVILYSLFCPHLLCAAVSHMPVHTGITQCYTVLGLNAEATAPMMTNTFYKITAR